VWDQAGYRIRCEWGPGGLKALAPVCDVVVIVDVLSFTTAVDIATAGGAMVFPFPLKGATAEEYAASLGARLASAERGGGFSLSPASLRGLPAESRLVLPSPNGAALACAADHPVVLAGCFRNAAATARAANRLGTSVALIPAGETWPDGSLRPCLEDLAGAGAIVAALAGTRSPEARLAVAAFEACRERLREYLKTCSSGQELIGRGFGEDVDLAAALDASHHTARLAGGAFVRIGDGG